MTPNRSLRSWFTIALVAVLFFVPFCIGLASLATHVSPIASAGVVLSLLALPTLVNTTHVFAAAATAPRLGTEERLGTKVYLPIAANTKIYAGTLVARDANGRAVPASDTAGLRVVGRADETIDNTGGAAGALSINVELGCFLFDNSATAAVDANDIGKMCVVEDDQTVAEDGTVNLVAAGRVVEVTSAGVWVDTRYAFFGPKTVIALTSTDGTAGAAADLAALKAEAEKIGDDVRALHSAIYG